MQRVRHTDLHSGTLASEISMRFGFRGLQPPHFHRLHVVHRCDRVRNADAAIRACQDDRGGRSRCTDRATDHARFSSDADHVHSLERISGPRFAAVFARSRRIRDRRRRLVLRSRKEEHARARGANIYGEVCGYGSTCEAYHRVRLEECGEEPARAIRSRSKRHQSSRSKCNTLIITAPPPS